MNMMFGSIKRLLSQTRHAIDLFNAHSTKTLRQTTHLRHLSNVDKQIDPRYDLNLVDFNMDRQFEEIRSETFACLAIDDNTKQMIEKILYEYEYEKYTTLNVPKTLTIDHMKELLLQENKGQRLRYFNFLFCKERDTFRNKVVKKRKSVDKQLELKEKYTIRNAGRSGIFGNDDNLVYGLWHNTLFTRIAKNSLSRQRDLKQLSAVMFGQKMVIDLSYDEYMNRGECGLLAKQIKEAYYYNKYRTIEPFDLMFTNCVPNGSTMEYIKRHVQESEKDSSYFRTRFFTQNYIDLFPRHELIYLSPDAKQSLKFFNPNAVYIIGGMVDKVCRDPVSMLKATKDQIKCYKLPLDEYVVWGYGGKSMCINHMVQILHDLKHTNDWYKALRDNVPQRKQKNIEEIRMEDEYRERKKNQRNRIQMKINSLKFNTNRYIS